MVWLRRMRYSRGFGVQSPWAYRFIRYVINEHYPYYEYTHLNKEVYGLNKFTRKLCRLYFRIANYKQPKTVVDYGAGTTAYRTYFKAGCNTCDVFNFAADDKGTEKLHAFLNAQPGLAGKTAYQKERAKKVTVDVARISLKGDYRAVVDELMDHATRNSLFIIQRIKKNKETERYWDSLTHDPRTGVTFDLYYCGLILFDKKIFKQNYIVNF